MYVFECLHVVCVCLCLKVRMEEVGCELVSKSERDRRRLVRQSFFERPWLPQTLEGKLLVRGSLMSPNPTPPLGFHYGDSNAEQDSL